MAELYRDNALLNGPYGITQGAKAIAATYANFVKPGVKHGHKVQGGRSLGNAMLCWGEWNFSPADGAKGLAGRYTAIYAKNERGWRIDALTYNFLPPPPAAKTQ